MKIENIVGGFTQCFDNTVVERIVCEYEKGICTVFFYDKSPKELHIGCDSYNSQYGIPISCDGSKLFIGAWAKGFGGLNKGIQAYEIESASALWRFNEGKIREIFVYPNYLIVSKALSNIFKIDINNGAVLDSIKSGTIESLYDLGFPYVLANTISGKLSVVDVEKMLVVKKYSKKITNPSNYLCHVIRDVTLRDNVLLISGFEDNPDYSAEFTAPNDFERVIDTDFYNI